MEITASVVSFRLIIGNSLSAWPNLNKSTKRRQCGEIPGIDRAGIPESFEQTLHGVPLEAVTRDSAGVLFAGSDEGKIYLSRDGGRTWREVFKGFPDSRGLWSLVAHPVHPGEVYAGLEPASLREHPASKSWRFFHPMKAHVRAISFDSSGDHLFVGIEEGGVLVSGDGGKSFIDISRGVDEDVHTLQVSPYDPRHLFAATGGGLFRSRDRGNRWRRLTHGLDRWYIVPILFSPADPRVLWTGAGNNPPPAWTASGANAALYRSGNSGETWETARGPFPLHGMVSALLSLPGHPDRLIAAATDGTLLTSADGGRSWQAAAGHLPRVEEMVVRPV